MKTTTRLAESMNPLLLSSEIKLDGEKHEKWQHSCESQN